MLQDEKVDVIYICTPNSLHKAHILKCLAHDKHVICAKANGTAYARSGRVFAMAKEKHRIFDGSE